MRFQHDLEDKAATDADSTVESWRERSRQELAATPLSDERVAPTTTRLDDRLETLVRHAIGAGAEQLHLATAEAPMGRFGTRMRPLRGNESCDGDDMAMMIGSALDPCAERILERAGAASRVVFVPPFGELKVHVWHSRFGLRAILYLPRAIERGPRRVMRALEALRRQR